MDDYNPEDELKHVQDYVPLEYKSKVIAYINEHPKHKFETIKAKFAKLKRKEYISRWRQDVKNGGNRQDKLKMIDAETFERFKEARAYYEQVKINSWYYLCMKMRRCAFFKNQHFNNAVY